MTIQLNRLEAGRVARIVKMNLFGVERRRLLDLGFVNSTEIMVHFSSPMGDPRAYRIKDTLIALRSETAAKIIVQLDEDKTI